MNKSALVVALLLASPLVTAAPRTLVPGKSEVAFSVKQMGVSVSGHFARFAAQVDLDPARLEAASAQVSIDVGSLSTGDDDADGTARDQPWLDVAEFPTAVFKSSAVKPLGGGRHEVSGALTLRGKSHDIHAPVSIVTAADGSSTVSGTFALRRSDFGVGGGDWNQGDVVADEVSVSFRFVLAPARQETSAPLTTGVTR